MSEALVQSLLSGKGLAGEPELIETHISWIILAGDDVYKLKKPVDLGFVDFSTLPKRKHFCEEELRLNRRAAPEIYLEVVPISGTESEPRLGDDTAPIEYAVKMSRFEQDSILDHLAEQVQLDARITSLLARAIADFHNAIADKGEFPFDDVLAHVREPVDENFRQLEPLVKTDDEKAALARLKAWSIAEFERLRDVFLERHQRGFMRECHGDLHLRNILYQDGKCIPFDCLEFNPALRWIDTANDIAFTVMDMETHSLHQQAHQLLIEYLEHTGDYDLLAVLRYYLVYRAIVRAKVDAIRSQQDQEHATALLGDCDSYLQMALRYTEPGQPALVLMCGISGSGKTTIGRQIATELSAIQVRSDVERKRIFDLEPEASSHASGIDIYTETASEQTFQRLASLTRSICRNRYLTLVDATFIDIDRRHQFEALAKELQVPWAIVHCEASPDAIAERLASRQGDASEAGMAQVESQRAAFDAFDEGERDKLVIVDTESVDSVVTASKRLAETLDKQQVPGSSK